MDKIIIPIIVAIISSNTLFGFIQFIDQGLVRMQLLVLISNYPDRVEEIMKLAKQYFCDFHGNYYLTNVFKEFLDKNGIIYPDWFIKYKD